MPYVKESHRKKLDPFLNLVAEELVKSSAALEKPQEIGHVYFTSFFDITLSVKELALGKPIGSTNSSTSEDLAKAIYEAGSDDGGFWAGDLNYALTRLLQIVPHRLVAQKRWDREFRYWTYAVTAGALEKTVLAINEQGAKSTQEKIWIDIALVGVLTDIKDEYKRRVNTPYEEEQRRINGDCYDVKL